MARTRIALFILLAVSSIACAQDVSWNLRIGERLPRELTLTSYPRLCTTAPGQTDPCRTLTVKNVDYTVAWNAETRTITYIYTEDPTFKTEDNVEVGTKLVLTEKDIKAYPGWLIVSAPTKDGWLPVVGRGNNLPKPDASGKVKVEILAFAKMK